MANQHNTSRTDVLVAILCALVVFASVLPWQTMNVGWGDDSAAYLSDAIAIAEGTYPEKIKLNHFMHPSPLYHAADRDTLVYVWGYPVMLSLVYRVVGFDRTDFHTVPYYQYVGIFSLSGLAAVLYLFFRRRAPVLPSAVMSLLFCSNTILNELVRILYSDVPFLLLAMLSFLLAERFADKTKTPRRIHMVHGLCLGAVLWYTVETRQAGSAVTATVAAAFLITCVSERRHGKSALLLAEPVAVFAVLRFVSEQLFFYPATSGVTDFVLNDFSLVRYNAGLLVQDLFQWFVNFTFIPGREDLHLAAVLILIGFILLVFLGVCAAWRGSIHYVVFTGGTYLYLLFLPYWQHVRYFLVTLPLLFLFAYEGARLVWEKIRIRLPRRTLLLAAVLSLFVCGFSLLRTAEAGVRLNAKPCTGAYADSSVSMYRYIQTELPEDAVIAFFKPRVTIQSTPRTGAKSEHSSKCHVENAERCREIAKGMEKQYT